MWLIKKGGEACQNIYIQLGSFTQPTLRCKQYTLIYILDEDILPQKNEESARTKSTYVIAGLLSHRLDFYGHTFVYPGYLLTVFNIFKS